MKISAADIKKSTIGQCEDWLEEISLTVVAVESRIFRISGEEKAIAESYLSHLKTIRYAINTRFGNLHRKQNEKNKINHLILEELKAAVGMDIYKECEKRARGKAREVRDVVLTEDNLKELAESAA